MSEHQTRKCWRCGEVKPLDAEHFHRAARKAMGLHDICKVCRAAYDRGAYHTTAESRAARSAPPVYWGEKEWNINDLTEKMEGRTAEDLIFGGSAFRGPVYPTRRLP